MSTNNNNRKGGLSSIATVSLVDFARGIQSVAFLDIVALACALGNGTVASGNETEQKRTALRKVGSIDLTSLDGRFTSLVPPFRKSKWVLLSNNVCSC